MATTAGDVRAVSITDQAVAPPDLVVAAATKVVWRNRGRNRHTVTADDGRFGSGTLFSGDTFTVRAPTAPGVYAYHCIFHNYIRGTVTVSPLSLAAPAPVDVGRRVRLRGTLRGGATGAPVSIQQRVAGAWLTVADTTANPAGAFSATSPPLTTSTVFRALAADAVGPAVPARVRQVVSVGRSGPRLTVRVTPAASGAVVHLERRDGPGRWSGVARRPLAGGRTVFTLESAGVYRARVAARAGLAGRASRPVGFR